jgi:hypothetical protein
LLEAVTGPQQSWHPGSHAKVGILLRSASIIRSLRFIVHRLLAQLSFDFRVFNVTEMR